MKEAINKWVFWCYNFTNPKEWIYEIWKGVEADHLYNKFCGLYEIHGCRGVMQDFYTELDKENGKKLLDWVLTNYNDEPKLG
jgi:hypothetical protein